MKKGFVKKSLLVLIIMAVTATFVAAQVNAPALINLKDAWKVEGKQNPVTFDHALHQKNNNCTDCHTSDQGGKFTPPGEFKGMNEKNAAHAFCWEKCHVEKKVSVGKTCTKCHKKA